MVFLKSTQYILYNTIQPVVVKKSSEVFIPGKHLPEISYLIHTPETPFKDRDY